MCRGHQGFESKPIHENGEKMTKMNWHTVCIAYIIKGERIRKVTSVFLSTDDTGRNERVKKVTQAAPSKKKKNNQE